MPSVDYPALAAALGGLAGVAAVMKTIFDWRKDRGVQRMSGEEQTRDALIHMNAELRKEVDALREELAEARREMNQLARNAERRLRECESRAVGFQRELASVQAELQYLKGRHPS